MRMPHANLLFVFLGVGTSLVQTTILYLLIRRKLFRELPFFTAYTALHVVLVPSLDIAYGRIPYATYFYVAWSFETLTVLLSLLIIREIFLVVFQSYGAGIKLTGWVFSAVGVILYVLAIMLAMHGTRLPEEKIVVAVLTVQRSLRFLQVGLLITLFVLCKYLRVQWRRHVFGVGLGFGIFGTINLAMFAVRFCVGPMSSGYIAFVSPIGYFFTALLWLFYFFQRPVQRPIANIVPVQDLAKWNTALVEYLKD